MIYLLCLLVSWLLGRGVLRILYGERKRRNQALDLTCADSLLTGGIVIIGLAEAAHLGAVVLGRSFSDCVKLFLIGLVLLLIVAAVMIIIGQRKAMTVDEHQTEKRIVFFVFGVMVLIQLLLMVTGQKIYPTGDMTAETVNSILATDSIYQVNPLTGQAYTQGIPMRLKILCLPTLYAIMCDVFGMGVAQVVWTVVPVFTLLGSYLAFYTVARALFPAGDRKRGIFMVLVALLLWMGDYMYGMDGFALQYGGFRGVSIRMAVLLPYTFGLVLRRKWKLVLLCILAEACIVWTLYGMGACLFVAVGMLLVGMFHEKIMKRSNVTLQGGEGGDL